MDTATIKKFLKHFKHKPIDLYGNETIISEELLKIFKLCKESNYTCWINVIWEAINKDHRSYEVQSLLFIINYLWFLERWTSIRYNRIDYHNRDIFDLLVLLMEKDKWVIIFKIDMDWYYDDYDETNEEHIQYIQNILTQ